MKLKYAVLAEKVFLDQESLDVSVSSFLDDLLIRPPESDVVEAGTVIPIACTLLTVWQADDSPSKQFSFWVEGPNGKGNPKEIELDFAANERFLHRMRFQGIEFRGSGEYCFMISYHSNAGLVEIPAWTVRIRLDQ